MSPLEGESFPVLPIGIDHIDVALSIGRRTEDQMPAIRRPGGRIIDTRSRRQLHTFLSVRRDDAELILFLCPAHIGNPIPARRPRRRRIVFAFIRQATHIRPI